MDQLIQNLASRGTEEGGIDISGMLSKIGFDPAKSSNDTYVYPDRPKFQANQVYLYRFELGDEVLNMIGHHWAVVVVRSDKRAIIYEINQPESLEDVAGATRVDARPMCRRRQFIDCHLMGTTNKTQQWIESWLNKYAEEKSYNIVWRNCQHMAQDLLKALELEQEREMPMNDVKKGLLFGTAALAAYGVNKLTKVAKIAAAEVKEVAQATGEQARLVAMATAEQAQRKTQELAQKAMEKAEQQRAASSSIMPPRRTAGYRN